MITITNIGARDNDILGWCDYEVRINQNVKITFKHKRSNGLGRCLMEAAKAVEKQKWEGLFGVLGEEEL